MFIRLRSASKKIKKMQNTGLTSTLCLKTRPLKQVDITSSKQTRYKRADVEPGRHTAVLQYRNLIASHA